MNIYVLLIINEEDKVIKRYEMITPKEVYEIIKDFDFEKNKAKYACYKAMDTLEIFMDTISYSREDE